MIGTTASTGTWKEGQDIFSTRDEALDFIEANHAGLIRLKEIKWQPGETVWALKYIIDTNK